MTRLETTRMLIQHRRNIAAAQEHISKQQESTIIPNTDENVVVNQKSRVQDIISRNEEETTNELVKKTKSMRIISQARHEEIILTDQITKYNGSSTSILLEDLTQEEEQEDLFAQFMQE
jgi:hypothetical protein